jgi:hypothetical protein
MAGWHSCTALDLVVQGKKAVFLITISFAPALLYERIQHQFVHLSFILPLKSGVWSYFLHFHHSAAVKALLASSFRLIHIVLFPPTLIISTSTQISPSNVEIATTAQIPTRDPSAIQYQRCFSLLLFLILQWLKHGNVHSAPRTLLRKLLGQRTRENQSLVCPRFTSVSSVLCSSVASVQWSRIIMLLPTILCSDAAYASELLEVNKPCHSMAGHQRMLQLRLSRITVLLKYSQAFGLFARCACCLGSGHLAVQVARISY